MDTEWNMKRGFRCICPPDSFGNGKKCQGKYNIFLNFFPIRQYGIIAKYIGNHEDVAQKY